MEKIRFQGRVSGWQDERLLLFVPRAAEGTRGMRLIASSVALGVLMLGTASAQADTFATGSLIIPMDTTYQDLGMLRAYGLTYELLRNDVPVDWMIRKGKAHLGVDFVASATDVQSNAPITNYGYRGGPWVIDSAYAAKAMPIITAWQALNPNVKVHRATAPFTADVSRYLVIAPTIAMHADGNEKIARKYVQAAGIPDSTLSTAWAATSPDMITPLELAGPTATNHHDGALFDADGDPVYCQFMSMHWGVNDARDLPEAVAEVREFLKFETHFFAECQAVSAFENDLVNGLFVTSKGFTFGNTPGQNVDFFNDDSPFAQLDGVFQSVGGSEPSYTLASGGAYKASGIVMITEKGGVQDGVNDVWMTGYVDGACPPGAESCGTLGKVSYLGGHEYDVALPISKNPKTQGTRLFLNALFEAPCATTLGQPEVSIVLKAPATTGTANLTYTIDYANVGAGIALAGVLKDPIPAGSTFVSATGGGTFSGGVVTWNVGNLGAGEAGSVTVVVKLGGFGSYDNTAHATYRIGLNQRTADSNTATTVYAGDTDGDGVIDPDDNCPNHPNPGQNLQTDIKSCGTCGTVCVAANGTPSCDLGVCSLATCIPTHTDCDGLYSTGCEFVIATYQTDPNNCGGCGKVCSFLHAAAVCVSGNCGLGTCSSGFSDCNGFALDGCEYANTGFQTDPSHCGSCTKQCSASQVCTGGTCVATTCPSGFSDCNQLSSDGCEYANGGFASDPNNCGACGLSCSPQNSTGACIAGACTIGSCNAGFTDCDGAPGDGCEYAVADFQTDPSNCGGCGQNCAPAHATGVCSAGTCSVGVCSAGFLDCNGAAGDGCETSVSGLQTDVANCGACGQLCAPANAAGACNAGACAIGTCNAGFVDLDQNPSNGCEYVCTPKGSSDTTCDDVDDDCNGTRDDGYVSTQCGVGACTANSVCASGAETCTPAPSSTEGPGGSSTCADGADNDCDGETDDADSNCVVADAGAGGAAGAAGAGGAAGTAGAGGTAGANGGGGLGGSSGSDSGAQAGTNGGGTDGGGTVTTGTGGTVTGSGGRAGTGASAGSSASSGTGGGSSAGMGDGGPQGTPTSSGGDASSGDTGGCGCRLSAREPANGWASLLVAAAAGLRLRGRRRHTVRTHGVGAMRTRFGRSISRPARKRYSSINPTA
jgi:uncharacterized repeat protein (TIGR01451 family)